jgi:hypothetical protein
MKTKDITPSVMSKVARYERDRIRLFRRRLAAVLIVIGGILAVSVGIVVWQLYQMQAFDLLTLFAEDRQIIAEFWRDTLVVFWEEIPPVWFWGAVLCLVSIGGILLLTQRKRAMDKKKLSQLNKY